jgi:hypothetical protein
MQPWIKVRADLLQDTRVLLIAERLGVLPVAAQGACVAFWQWADGQTADGHLEHATARMLDARVGIDGFARELAAVGWLIVDDDGGLAIPHHHEHNGQCAKARALAGKRQTKHRARNDGSVTPVTDPSRCERDNSVTRGRGRGRGKEECVPSEHTCAADAANARTGEGDGSPLLPSEGPDPTRNPPKGARTPETGTTGRTRGKTGKYPDDFAAWWSAYPVTPGASRGSKADAAGVWAKLDADERAAALEGLDAYAGQLTAARERGFDQQSAHAVTWLRARRWEGAEAPARTIDTPVARKGRSIAESYDAGFGDPNP